MKFKVIAPFNDKNENKLYTTKDIYETDDKDRVAELKGYIGEEIKSEENSESIEKLEDMTVPKLKDYADSKGIKLPADVKKKDDIVQYLHDNRKSDED